MNLPASLLSCGDASVTDAGTAEDGYFMQHLGASLEQLLAPIDERHPAGLPVRGSMVFRMVEQARRSDDATLPMGSWAVELKRANWPKVSSLIVNVLSGTSKDLQLASWLLEAEIHQRGFAALAPGIALMHGLCERWWQELHPQGESGDVEPRANIVRWVNEKLLAPLSLVPLAAHGELTASWSNWELAHHYERLRAAKGDLPEEAQSAMTLDNLHGLLAAAPLDALRERHAELASARSAIDAFESSLRERMANEAPSLGKLDDLIARVQTPLRAEMARRGEPLLCPATSVVIADTDAIVTESPDEAGETVDAEPNDLLSDRSAAYRALADIAEFLAHIEPHSPVPYLLRRAVWWGGLNTAELYRELFVKGNGQINLFEVLGVLSADAAGTN